MSETSPLLIQSLVLRTSRQRVVNRGCYRIGTRLVDALKRIERRVGQGGSGSCNSAKLYNAFFIGDRRDRINYFLLLLLSQQLGQHRASFDSADLSESTCSRPRYALVQVS